MKEGRKQTHKNIDRLHCGREEAKIRQNSLSEPDVVIWKVRTENIRWNRSVNIQLGYSNLFRGT